MSVIKAKKYSISLSTKEERKEEYLELEEEFEKGYQIFLDIVIKFNDCHIKWDYCSGLTKTSPFSRDSEYENKIKIYIAQILSSLDYISSTLVTN